MVYVQCFFVAYLKAHWNSILLTPSYSPEVGIDVIDTEALEWNTDHSFLACH